MQTELHKIIAKSLLELQSRHPGYSLRRFARKVDLPSAVVSEVLRGKRTLTRNLEEELITDLNIDSRLASKLILEIPEKKRRRKRSEITADETLPKNNYHLLQIAELSAVSDWWNFAILRAIETKKTQNADIQALGKRLGLSKKTVSASIENLVRLGLLENIDGILRSTEKTLTTTFDIPSSAIRKNHLQGLELAQDALREIPVELRDYSAITVTFDPERLAVIKSKIENFRRELMNEMLSTPKKEVYRLQIQLFPLTHRSRSKTRKEQK